MKTIVPWVLVVVLAMLAITQAAENKELESQIATLEWQLEVQGLLLPTERIEDGS